MWPSEQKPAQFAPPIVWSIKSVRKGLGTSICWHNRLIITVLLLQVWSACDFSNRFYKPLKTVTEGTNYAGFHSEGHIYGNPFIPQIKGNCREINLIFLLRQHLDIVQESDTTFNAVESFALGSYVW